MGSRQEAQAAQQIHERRTRRWFFGVTASAGILLTAGFGLSNRDLFSDSGERKKTGEELYGEYDAGLEAHVGNIEQATEVLSFVRTYRRRGSIDNGQLRKDEHSDPKRNFHTVFVDPRTEPISYRAMRTFAVIRPQQGADPAYLLLPDVQISRVWAGSVLGHEGLHLKELLQNSPQAMDGDDLDDEIRGYDLQRALLSNATGGNYAETINTFAGELHDGEYKGSLTNEENKLFDAMFGRPLSIQEFTLRETVSVFAVNFANAEIRAGGSPADAFSLKHKYLEAYDRGEIKGKKG